MSAPSPAAALLAQTPLDFEPTPAPAPRLLQVVEPRPSLRKCVNRVDYIADTIEQMDDAELDEATRDALSAELIEALAGTREKVDATAAVLAMFEHLQSSSEAEAKRCTRRAEYFGRQTERLERYVLAVLEASKLDRIEGETNTLQRKLNPAKVVIHDAAAIPAEYMRTPEPPPPPAPAPDKAAIAKAIKAKQVVPGCSLTQGARLVRS